MMLEGMSVCAISRITGLHKNTILSLMVTASENAQRVFDSLVRNVCPKFVQLDELWCMVGCHGKNVQMDSPSGWGDQWTWLALDSDSKMILSFHVGARNTVSAYQFVRDLSERTLGTYQITVMPCAVMSAQSKSGMVRTFPLPSFRRFTGALRQAQSGTVAAESLQPFLRCERETRIFRAYLLLILNVPTCP
jgi:hypothetical protein